ncbi:hypothetical protein [Thiolapillus sp.]|uniref:hypothetical protein n=1 Tax=Thiolapillus sp. TaxID=2017437 RepID=UPI003AF48ECF
MSSSHWFMTPEQVDLSGLVLSHYRLTPQQTKWEVREEGGPLKPIGGDLREGRDRERTYLQELIQRLNEAFGKEISDKDKVAFAVHISEKLRDNRTVMAQVRNNPKEQAMRADLPGAATKAIVEAMSSHSALSKRLLSDETTRDLFLSVIYEMLKKDVAGELLSDVREES